MALIKCEDCGKEVSDSSDFCVNCGCPVIDKSQFKKFDFNKILKPSYKREVYYKNARSLFFLLVSFVGFNYLLFINWEPHHSSRGSIVDFIGLILWFSVLITIIKKIFYLFFPSGNWEENVRIFIIDGFYREKLPFITRPKFEKVYEELGFIEGDSKLDLLEEAFYLKADAIIEPNSSKYTSTSVSGTRNSIRSSISTHKHWSGIAIKFKVGEYHDTPHFKF